MSKKDTTSSELLQLMSDFNWLCHLPDSCRLAMAADCLKLIGYALVTVQSEHRYTLADLSHVKEEMNPWRYRFDRREGNQDTNTT